MSQTAERKTPGATRVVMTESVLPGDGNSLGTAFGGKIAQWIDVAAAIACQRHCRRRVVTASMDDLHYLLPIKVGMIVELRAQVNAVFRTSMEAGVRIESEDPRTGERKHVCSAFLTFVAQDDNGRPVEVEPLELDNDEDRRRAQDAHERRQTRLQHARVRRERLLAEERASPSTGGAGTAEHPAEQKQG